MAAPRKMKSAVLFTQFRDAAFGTLPIPNLEPKSISFLTIYLSIAALVVLRLSPLWFFILYTGALLLDSVDGMVARRFNRESEEGYLCDVVCDRLSEGIVLLHFGWAWFALFVINVFLSVASVKTNKHRILPLRAVFLVYFLLFLL